MNLTLPFSNQGKAVISVLLSVFFALFRFLSNIYLHLINPPMIGRSKQDAAAGFAEQPNVVGGNLGIVSGRSGTVVLLNIFE